ncbi:MAG TPA: peptide-N-glycosidase F-related protein [Polyangiaceae bacterium]|jgi:hypothetical protein
MRRAAVLVFFMLGCDATSSVPDAGVEAGPPARYAQTLLDAARIGSDSSQPNFQKATADVQLAGAPFASVNLVVDLTSTCFPFSNWKTDKPPPGQYWPADCDAFDRNFEMALFDPANPNAPGLELVRAITPFGGPEHIEQDVTDIFNALGGADRTFVVTIPSYSDSAGKVSGSKGGWNVSAHLDVVPGAPPRNVLAVQSLLYTSIGSSPPGPSAPASPPEYRFTLPPGTTKTTIEYRVTGHGGADDTTGDCIGPADEFCKRTHTLLLDGRKLDAMVPWRANCNKLCTKTINDAGAGPVGQYCLENPCGAIASVQAPRANWCPGSETPPFTYTPDLAPGDHTFAFGISRIAGVWRVSATVYAYGD